MIGNQSNLTAALNVFLQKVWTSGSAKNSFNQYWESLIDRDPQLTNVFIVIDMIWGGNKRILISTHPISATSSSTSNVYNYLPLLQNDVEIPSVYSIGAAAPSQRSLSITIDGRIIDPISIVLGGQSLAGFAEIALIDADGDYDNRFVIMKGDMSGGVGFGFKEETISTSIIDPSYTSDKITPALVADREKIPTLPDSYVGKRYPLVFGSYPYVPCIRMSEYKYGPSWLVCSGRDYIVQNVYINGNYRPPDDPHRGYEVAYTFDQENNPIIVLNFVATTVEWESGDTVYADLIMKDNAAEDLMEIMRKIIISSSMLNEVGLDNRLFFRAQTKLAKMYPKCLINGSGSGNTTRALEYIQSGLLASFPMVSMTYTGSGYGPIVTDRRSNIVVMDLIARQKFLFDRISDIQETAKSEVKNSFALRYNFNAVDNTYRSVITRDSTNSPLCKISEDLYGRNDGDVMESVIIFDDKTADTVVSWMVSHYSLPSYYVEYSAAPQLYFKLMLGDNINLTDDKLGISSQKCTVEKISYIKGQLILGLRMWILYDKLGTSTAFGGSVLTTSPITTQDEAPTIGGDGIG